uniref:DENN domain-containing protein n=1 Tax=Macrostomum lignano TaxID=282301 RepID=A0A1I8JMZ1_9PLAT
RAEESCGGKLVQRFPITNWEDFAFVEHQELFCQPCGWHLTSPASGAHIFCWHTFTSESAPSATRPCSIFYEPVSSQQKLLCMGRRPSLGLSSESLPRERDQLEQAAIVTAANVLRSSSNGLLCNSSVRRQLGIHNCILLVTALLTGCRVALFSYSYARLTSACRALTALLYPRAHFGAHSGPNLCLNTLTPPCVRVSVRHSRLFGNSHVDAMECVSLRGVDHPGVGDSAAAATGVSSSAAATASGPSTVGGEAAELLTRRRWPADEDWIDKQNRGGLYSHVQRVAQRL